MNKTKPHARSPAGFLTGILSSVAKKGKQVFNPEMPWKASDAKRHTRKADTPKRKRQWSKVADKVLNDIGDEGKSIRIANSAVRKSRKKRLANRRF